MAGYEKLASITPDALLAGPDRVAAYDAGKITELLDIDRIHAKSARDILQDYLRFDPAELELVSSDMTPSDVVKGYWFAQVGAGLILLDDEKNLAGVYLGPYLAVEPDHQGQGLGAELVLELYLRREDMPVWDLDDASYTPAGEGAHRAAWCMLQDEPLCRAKMARHVKLGPAMDRSELALCP